MGFTVGICNRILGGLIMNKKLYASVLIQLMIWILFRQLVVYIFPVSSITNLYYVMGAVSVITAYTSKYAISISLTVGNMLGVLMTQAINNWIIFNDIWVLIIAVAICIGIWIEWRNTPENGKNYKQMLIQMLIFIVLCVVGKGILRNVYADELYVLRWLTWHYCLYLWVPVTVLTYLNFNVLGLVLTVGSIVGIVLGQLLGDVLYRINYDPNAYENNHIGAFIWMFVVLISLILGIVGQKLKNKKKNNFR